MAVIFPTGGLTQCQLAGTAAIITAFATTTALFALTVCFALGWLRCRLVGWRTTALRRCSRRCRRSCSTLGCFCGFSRFFFLALFFFSFLAGTLFSFTLFTLFGFRFLTATLTLFGAGLFFGFAACCVFGFARFCGLKRLQAAFHFRIRNASGAAIGIATRFGAATSTGFGCTRLGHHNALALRFHHDIFLASVAKALRHIARAVPTAQTQGFFTVVIAHLAVLSFPEAAATVSSRTPFNLRASSTTRFVSPPDASAPCITVCRPKAKPNSSAVSQSMW